MTVSFRSPLSRARHLVRCRRLPEYRPAWKQFVDSRAKIFGHRHELDAVRDLLVVVDAGVTVGITTALRGAGGFGKTTLAQALCEDPRVREAYPDGIIWAQMRDDMREADRLAKVPFLHRSRPKWA